MSYKTNIKATYKKFRQVGEAILRVNGNSIHSGNLSLRDPDDPDRFYITASGSQKGALVLRDIVPVRFSSETRGDRRASTESNIHRKVLSIPGVNACLHCHHFNSALITFDTREKQIFLHFKDTDSQGREEFVFQPVDIHGCSILGGVVVGSYKEPIGSTEMEERIPRYLSVSPLTLVKGHGPFARGRSLEECLRSVSVLENSATIAASLRRRGIDLRRIQKEIMEQGARSVFRRYVTPLNGQTSAEDRIDDVSMVPDFAYWLSYVYNYKMGGYATGSMSRKVTSDEMIFCPMSSVPENMDFPLYRVSTKMEEGDNTEVALHKLIYNYTDYAACIMAANPLACSDGMAVLAEEFGSESLLGEAVDIPYLQKDHPVISPIDAEGIYLNPRLGLVDITQLDNLSSENPILDMLRWHKGCCVVASFGVIAVGDTTLEQAAHNIASAERICNFRTEVSINERLLNGPPVKSFESKTL